MFSIPQQVYVVERPGQNTHGTIGGFGMEEYFVEEEEDDYEPVKRGKGKKGKKGKKKGGKKIMKKIRPMLIGIAVMKMLMYHLLMKKMAFSTFLSFLLSKAAFILASLVAFKQFFHTPTQHRSTESNKLEVVHIPIRNLRHNKHKEKDSYYEESKFMPVTFSPDTGYDTTPFYYDFPYRDHNPDAFISSEETFNGNFGGKFSQNFDESANENFNDIYNEHFDERFKDNRSKADDKADQTNEKTFYKNHVHSPFV